MKKAPTPPDNAEFFTPEQAAIRLQVLTSTVLRWLNNGTLAGIKLGGRRLWRISRQEIERFEKGER